LGRLFLEGLRHRLVNVSNMMATNSCCAECGEEGGASLKVCKACMHARYCSAACQRNHWPKHKKECKQRAAELRDEALFKDPPAKEECPLLPTHATSIDMLCFASTRDYIVRTCLRICESKSRVVESLYGGILFLLREGYL